MNSWLSLGYIESAFTFSLTVLCTRIDFPILSAMMRGGSHQATSLCLLSWGSNGKLCFSSLPSVAVINTRTKSNFGEERLAGASFREVRSKAQGRNLGSGTEAETLEEHWLLGLCSTPFLIKTRLTSLGMMPSTVGYTLPPLAIKKMPHIRAYMPV